MCHAVRCKTCTKATWAGCGRHVESALAGIASQDRCPGHPKDEQTGFLRRLLGGRS